MKFFKWGVYFLFGLCLIFLHRLDVSANTLNHLSIDVFLDDEGHGHITEKRDMTMTSGTELYINMGDLKGSEVSDFSVNGFTNVGEGNWDYSGTLEDKSHRYVLDKDSNELVWGIGEYGDQSYTLRYTISDMVRILEDGQAFYYGFNTWGELSPEDLSITVRGYEPFRASDAFHYWGFGSNNGHIQLLDTGVILADFDQAIQPNQTIALLVQFPSDYFKATSTFWLDQTLEAQRTFAETGQNPVVDGPSTSYGDILDRYPTLGHIFVSILTFSGVLCICIGRHAMKRRKLRDQALNALEKQAVENGSIDWNGFLTEHADSTSFVAPNEPIEVVSAAFNKMGIELGLNDLFSYLLLKWASHGHLTFKTLLNPEKPVIKLINSDAVLESSFEKTVFSDLWKIADENGLILEKDISSWFKSNPEQYKMWSNFSKDTDDLYESEYHWLNKNEIYSDEHQLALEFDTITSEGLIRFEALYGFYRFISNVVDGQCNPEGKLHTDDLLIWATAFGFSRASIEKIHVSYPDLSEPSFDLDHIQSTEHQDDWFYYYMLFSASKLYGSQPYLGKQSYRLNDSYSSSSTSSLFSSGGGFSSMGGGGGGVR